MKRTSLLLLFLSCVFASAQSKPALKKGDRPVFMTAARLVFLCEDWSPVFYPAGKPLNDSDQVKISGEQLAHALGCDSYILGVEDEGLSFMGPNYHPVPSRLDYMKSLIDTFIKLVKDHPEKEQFAASTLLKDAEKLITATQSSDASPTTKK